MKPDQMLYFPQITNKCFDERFNEKEHVAKLMAKEMNRGAGPILSTDAHKRKELDIQAVLTDGMCKALGKSNASVSKGRLCKCPLFLEYQNLIQSMISGLTTSAFL